MVQSHFTKEELPKYLGIMTWVFNMWKCMVKWNWKKWFKKTQIRSQCSSSCMYTLHIIHAHTLFSSCVCVLPSTFRTGWEIWGRHLVTCCNYWLCRASGRRHTTWTSHHGSHEHTPTSLPASTHEFSHTLSAVHPFLLISHTLNLFSPPRNQGSILFWLGVQAVFPAWQQIP